MRPGGDIRTALLCASRELLCRDGDEWRGATLKEMAHKACVGHDAARVCVSNLKRSGALAIVRERRVDYRNRPVAEYAPSDALEAKREDVFVDLNQCMADWVR